MSAKSQRKCVGCKNAKGTKAKQLLIKERNRVGARLATLDQSLLALRDSGRQQAQQLRRATAALHDIDNALRAV
ncbi:hypothetical protein RR48_01902 [Papilio machaon]|uniref:Uncharacterized protein n=1 Tax=Papilio machaon TaxID=76193 RepID=A0A0N1IPN4_PAPMA|nr:hypothetical protein RR48_01902 [Papilio machaon]